MEGVDLRGSSASSLADSGDCPTSSGGESEPWVGAVHCCDGEPSTTGTGSPSSEEESGRSLLLSRERSAAACSDNSGPVA